MFKKLKEKITRWCLNEQTVHIETLHKSLKPYSCEIYNKDSNELKFIEQTTPHGVLVKTHNGFSPIKHSHKTIEYGIWKITTKNYQLECADEHVVVDQFNNNIYVRDLKIGDKIKTSSGIESVISVVNTDNSNVMFDLELDDCDHVYYTNNILSHNSITSGAYLLWYAIFKFDKTILIASNKNSNAMEMISRIRFAYENLPHWLKPGIQEDGWNKHSIGFDNGSRIVSTATSEDSGRGMSISLLFLDEFAFVTPAIQDEFWTAIKPTLSTGGACLMTSTPNGDMNIFAQIWRGAQVGANSFFPIRVRWDEPPGRDERFKEDEIGDIGERKWLQEYECVSGETCVTVETTSGDTLTISMYELYNLLHDKYT